MMIKGSPDISNASYRNLKSEVLSLKHSVTTRSKAATIRAKQLTEILIVKLRVVCETTIYGVLERYGID